MGRVQMSAVAEHIADAIGVKFDKVTADVFEKPTVVGPLGLRIPTEFRYSHGTQQESYLLVCWKVSGDLYTIVAHEPETSVTTVALLDKRRWSASQEDPKTYLATVATAAINAGRCKTLDKYLEFFADSIVGAWCRKAGGLDWTKLNIGGGVEPVDSLEQREG